MKNYELRNGVSIPEIGYGTWKTPDGETCEKAVETAIRLGYHHIDAATILIRRRRPVDKYKSR